MRTFARRCPMPTTPGCRAGHQPQPAGSMAAHWSPSAASVAANPLRTPIWTCVLLHTGRPSRSRTSPKRSGIRSGTAGWARSRGAHAGPGAAGRAGRPEGAARPARRAAYRRGYRCIRPVARAAPRLVAGHGAQAGSPNCGKSAPPRWRIAGDAAFLLEPNLKDSRGGLRDAQTLHALAIAQLVDYPQAVREAYGTLLDIRGELHRRLKRDEDVVRQQEQPELARTFGLANADALLRRANEAARTIGLALDVAWRRVEIRRRPPRALSPRRLLPGTFGRRCGQSDAASQGRRRPGRRGRPGPGRRSMGRPGAGRPRRSGGGRERSAALPLRAGTVGHRERSAAGSRGRPRPWTISWPCSAPDTGRCRSWNRSTRLGCLSGSSRNGMRFASQPSTIRCIASPSTATCWKRRPKPPIWSARCRDRTCCSRRAPARHRQGIPRR